MTSVKPVFSRNTLAPAARTTWLDRLLQRWRVRMALRELPPVGDLLDIGTYDGTMLRRTKAHGVGIDPELAGTPALPGVTFVGDSSPPTCPPWPTARSAPPPPWPSWNTYPKPN